jgi:hypothetical protein
VRTFIEHNPEYADLIDPKHPGVTKGAHRAGTKPPGHPDREDDSDDQHRGRGGHP